SPLMATRARQSTTGERPLGELFSEMTQQLQVLMRKEIELAKVETKEQLSQAGKTGAIFGAMAVVGLIAALILAMAAAWGLAEVMPVGVAFLIVGVVLLVITLVLLQSGKKRAAALRPVPAQTIATVKDDVDEAKSAIQRGAQNDNWSNNYGRNAS
ncbi:MAG TPA: phage holin family protein, partial [Acidimicrobiales bacterium]